MLYKLDRVLDAEKSFNKALEKDRLLVGGYLDLGRLYMDHGETDKALQCFSRVVEIQSFNAEGQYFLGKVQLEKGLVGDAEKAWKECAKLDPTGRFGKKAAAALKELKRTGSAEGGNDSFTSFRVEGGA